MPGGRLHTVQLGGRSSRNSGSERLERYPCDAGKSASRVLKQHFNVWRDGTVPGASPATTAIARPTPADAASGALNLCLKHGDYAQVPHGAAAASQKQRS